MALETMLVHLTFVDGDEFTYDAAKEASGEYFSKNGARLPDTFTGNVNVAREIARVCCSVGNVHIWFKPIKSVTLDADVMKAFKKWVSEPTGDLFYQDMNLDGSPGRLYTISGGPRLPPGIELVTK